MMVIILVIVVTTDHVLSCNAAPARVGHSELTSLDFFCYARHVQ